MPTTLYQPPHARRDVGAQEDLAVGAQEDLASAADDTISSVDVAVDSPARRIATPMRAAMSLGVIAVCAALAIPALTDGGGAGANDAGASVPSALISDIVGDPSGASREGYPIAAAPTAANLADQWAADRATWTPEQELAFKLFVATPEERAAWEQFVDPPPPPTTAPPTTTARKATSTGGGAPGGFLACVRHRESRGNYGVVNGSSGAGGAYQFLPGTWNNVARHIGRSDLVGVHPSQASRSDQDSMAQALYSWQGGAPWAGPGC